MNRLTKDERVRVIAALVEGNSIRATVCVTGVAKNTLVKLLCDIGQACDEYHDHIMVNLPCKRIQVDEIWSFYYAKEKNLPDLLKVQFGYGDVWTRVALDAHTKLVLSWLVGWRDAEWPNIFMQDLASRLKHRLQLTSDGHKAYLNAVEEAFGGDIDYATLIKLYGMEKPEPEHPVSGHKYSLGHVTGC